ncbi:hypothetical protein R1sor_024780 [Riccia sorocarpa]|uniref:(S)-2-hydroxy-acid oxidase n=1 Tax=Riccia sorocarpa TaxID=122646 RepID=A0ABD3GTX0_9MARC
MSLAEVVNVNEYEARAKQKLSKMFFDYFSTGAEDQWTLQENIRAFGRIRIRPRVLVDVSDVDLSTKVLGYKVSMPIMVAPTGHQKLAHAEGELATARAAAAEDTVMVLSSSANTSLEDVASIGSGIRFFQLYIFKDREYVAEVVRRAERAGYKAIVLTGDVPRLGNRENDIKNRFTLPAHLTVANFVGIGGGTSILTSKTNESSLAAFANAQFDSSLTWKDIAWLKGITSLPILIKGILTGEDAVLAVRSGVAGIMVSNHGARQLDFAPASVSVLEEVVQAVQGRVPVFLDGGVRRGSDVLKALALGAAGVFVGRPVVYGLAVDGEAGVRKVLKILRDEFQVSMMLAGCRRIQDITRSHVLTESELPCFSKL